MFKECYSRSWGISRHDAIHQQTAATHAMNSFIHSMSIERLYVP